VRARIRKCWRSCAPSSRRAERPVPSRRPATGMAPRHANRAASPATDAPFRPIPINLETAVDLTMISLPGTWHVVVGANSFAPKPLTVRINSHLGAPALWERQSSGSAGLRPALGPPEARRWWGMAGSFAGDAGVLGWPAKPPIGG